jgi:hypothetical protein
VILRLTLLAEVAAARLPAMQRVDADQLGQLQEVGHASRLFQRLIHGVAPIHDHHVSPKLLPKLRDTLQRLAQAGFVPGHAAMVPHEEAQFSMEGVHRALPLEGKQAADAVAHLSFRATRLGVIGRDRVELGAGKVIRDGRRENEVAVGQPLHQRAGPQPVGAVVREVGLAADE